MNIFYLDHDIDLSVRFLCDKHVVNNPKETAQILCSAFEPNSAPYKRTHYNHPSNRWTRESKAHYLWLIEYGLKLSDEYTFRYEKTHKSSEIIRWCKENIGKLCFDLIDSFSLPPQVMPKQYRRDDIVEAYRTYYISDKAYFAKWNKQRSAPYWWPN